MNAIPTVCRDVYTGTDEELCTKLIELEKYNEFRLRLHNETRNMHANTGPLAFDLETACEA